MRPETGLSFLDPLYRNVRLLDRCSVMDTGTELSALYVAASIDA